MRSSVEILLLSCLKSGEKRDSLSSAPWLSLKTDLKITDGGHIHWSEVYYKIFGQLSPQPGYWPDSPGKWHAVLSQFAAELLVGFQNLLNNLCKTKSRGTGRRVSRDSHRSWYFWTWWDVISPPAPLTEAERQAKSDVGSRSSVCWFTQLFKQGLHGQGSQGKFWRGFRKKPISTPSDGTKIQWGR